MKLLKKFNSKRGFTLAELVIVVAIIAILAGIAVTFINPKDISYVEYNRSAEAIATAVQNRLTEIRNSGNMEILRRMGEQYVSNTGAAKAEVPSGDGSGETPGDTSKDLGGYRYVFNYNESGGAIERNSLISYILPFGAIDYDLAQNFYAIGFQSDTGMVGEVFYSTMPFAGHSASYLLTISGDSEQAKQKRKAENVGYYQGTTYEEEVAFANLPTPQLTITNYETLTLSIYLPEVKQLEESGKNLGILVSLSDKNGEAYKKGLTVFQTAIYSTFSSGNFSEADGTPQPVVINQNISSGGTYKIILDTVQDCNETNDLNRKFELTPRGKFEQWATRSGAFKDGYFELGDNNEITVTVYCMDGKFPEGVKGVTSDETVKIDPTYLPRSASLIFNGWFNNYNDSTAYIACGRHLQNLNNLTEMRSKLLKYLPEYKKTSEGYSYSDYNYGMANAYTDGGSNANVSYEDITEKYDRRANTKRITQAQQVNAIDFNCAEWKDILFTPINLPHDFYYYGNYLTISYLNVKAPFYAGLFGYAYHARLYDILLVNPSVMSYAPARLTELYEMGVGALIGTSRHSSHINNCQVYMTPDKADGKYHPEKYRVQGECYVGGLIGFCEDENIQNCSASVYTGYAEGATKTVTTLSGTGTETSPVSSRYVGGLIGCITGDSSIKNCYAAGNLSGDYVGGLVGYIVEDSDPSGDDYRIETCYTAGHIEYATVEAAGILGYISELAGNAKSALSIYGNYCVVIYGKKNSEGNYEWTYKLSDGITPVPIYGTFKGDGFEWLRTSTLGGYSDTYLTGTYGGHTYFAGAVFENENKNYYIKQKGITYANSSYFTSMQAEVQELLNDIKSADVNTVKEKVKTAKEKVFWLKKLQTLEQLKLVMEQIIYEVDNETGTYTDLNGKTRPYNFGGYGDYETKKVKDEDGNEVYVEDTDKSKYTEDFYLATLRAKIEQNKENSHGSVKLTVVQAVHAMYDKTYPTFSDDGNTVTGHETLSELWYNGSESAYKDPNKYLKNGDSEDYSFMNFYNVLKQAYKDLLDDNNSNDEGAKAVLTTILGSDSGKNYGKDGKRFYESGLFYNAFYKTMLYRVFDKCKDYFQYGLKDKDTNKYGELIYRHFRDLCESKFLGILCDLGMSMEGRDYLVSQTKLTVLDKIITELTANLEIYKEWRDNEIEKDEEGNEVLDKNSQRVIAVRHMKDDAETAKTKTNAAITAVTELRDLMQGEYTAETLKEKMDAAEKALKDLYDFFDGEDAYGKGLHRKDVVDYIGKDDKGKLLEGDMRNFRDPIAAYRRDVQLCVATANSGVENALDELLVKLNKTGANAKTLVDEFEKNVNTYLGTAWGNTDSGHALKNAEELRNAARGFIYGKEVEAEQGSSLGFMYDYGNKYTSHDKDINPYTNSGNPVPDGSYVDKKDNGIYNNVFPYEENQFTKYYPFPFVYGRDVENGKRVLYVLFHYGDWLTEDLWAAPTITYHTDYPTMEGFSGEDIELSQYRVTNVNSFAPDEDIITSNDENIEIPFYFEGWYVDEDKTIPYSEYSEEFKKSIEAAAINGEEKNFDLYAKWVVKPSLTFYAADLEGSYNGDTIIVDTKITLTSGGTSKTSEKANSYQKFTVWFKPEQDVLLSVIGHYKYDSFLGNRDVTNWVFEDQNGKKTYMFDSLTIVQPTEFTGAVWFGNDNKNEETGEVTFTIPPDATDSDKYEITLSEQSSSGGFEFNICLAEGTMIRMADGSKKAVENLEVGDTVLAFNHLTGKYEPTTVWITPHTDLESKLYIVTTLDFSDGSSLKIVGEHGLFDRTLNKYVFINESNYNEYIGHKFSAVTATESGFEDRTVTLASVSVNSEITKIYSPITENHLNIVAEDLLTVTSMMGYGDAVMNIFDYEPDMSYDKIQMAADIDKYGVYSYEDFADMLPQEVYAKVPLKVMKVAVGKGLISYEEVKQIIEYIYKNGYLS